MNINKTSNIMYDDDELSTFNLESSNEWLVKGENKYSPSPKTVKKLPRGFYEVGKDSMGIFLEEKPIISDELYNLPSNELLEILDDIKLFWNSKEKYEKYNFVHKRGILLYGKPGNGKSGIIQLITNHLIKEMKGLVINIKNADELYDFSKIVTLLRSIEPNTPLVVILEDLDGIIESDGWVISTLLNLLDGVKQINNVVYVATTNYVDQLEKRIVNRPSRFDRRYEIPTPNDEVRREFIKYKLSEEDLKSIDLEKWVEETKDLSLSHLKELIISVIVLNLSFETTLNKLKELNSSFTSIDVD